MAKFFIDRPIFAIVLSILIALAGGLTVGELPISQFPPVTPPTIQVDCNYPGASSEIVAQTIAAPIEQRVNGVERMLYMNSQSTNDGSYTLTVTFETGTNLDLAQVMVQNRVNLALPELPEVVRAVGVVARKRSPEILLTISINSPDRSYDQLYLSNYAALHVREELVRVAGISEVLIFGQRDYSMRVWVDPDKLEGKDVTVLDVMAAIRSQNREVALGHVGSDSSDRNPSALQLTVTSQGRLETPEDFGRIVIKNGGEGQLIRLRDVATVQLGARSSDITNMFDNKPTVGLAVFLQPDANALYAAEELKRLMAKQEFPQGIKYEVAYDTTPYIGSSIREVFKALRDAIILVAIVVLVFLQSWRSALIPLATVPVAIIGTFAAMWLVGFGLNNLTLFGVVLAVGIVVDDAIVVVEAVQHQMELGYEPREATLRAMKEVSGPVIAVGLVLSAVFLPCMFFPGIVGLFFRQFALTIAISTLISTFNSLSLCPALAVVLLQPKSAKPDFVTRTINFLFGWFFWLFNKAFDESRWLYLKTVAGFIRLPVILFVVYLLAIAGGYRLYQEIPTGFIPTQDKGYLIASVQLPDAASAEQTRAVMEQITDITMGTPGVKHVNAVVGNSFVLSAYGSNFGSMFIILDEFEKRETPELYASVIATKIQKRVAEKVLKAQVNVFPAPAVPGLGRAGGLRLMVQDRGEVGLRMLQGQTQKLVDEMALQPAPGSVQIDMSLLGAGPVKQPPPMFLAPFTVFRTNSPQLRVIVNDAECVTNGVDPLDVYSTMSASLGQRYVNDFNRFGRTFQVNVQASPEFRNQKEDVRRLRVRNKYGQLVPLGTLVEILPMSGPQVITRYNRYPAASINTNIAAGTSSGLAIATAELLAERELPTNMSYEWTELAFIERRSRDTGAIVFVIAVLVVFLVLAALYESWTLPIAVILVVPTCVLSALVGVYFAKQDVNLFTQVGFVVLIGLACKNAILIIEYAKKLRESGHDRRESILEACKLRLRPILMTSLAFILGVLPLAIAEGAGAEMRRALGVTVFSGMLGVTIFGVVLTPVFFVLVDKYITRRKPMPPLPVTTPT
jgi:multidrug efflux pump